MILERSQPPRKRVTIPRGTDSAGLRPPSQRRSRDCNQTFVDSTFSRVQLERKAPIHALSGSAVADRPILNPGLLKAPRSRPDADVEAEPHSEQRSCVRRLGLKTFPDSLAALLRLERLGC